MWHAYGNANGNGHIHSDSNCHGNSYAYTDSNADCDGHIHADSDCHGNSYAYTDSNADCDSNSNSDRTAAAYTNATASADTAASPLACCGIRGTRENELASSQLQVDRSAAADDDKRISEGANHIRRQSRFS